jgi:hypothetical protein
MYCISPPLLSIPIVTGFTTVQGVTRLGERGRQAISSFPTLLQLFPDRPKATIPAKRCNFPCHCSIFLVYSWCSFPIVPTLMDVALPGHKRQSSGGLAMTFEEIVDRALAMLQRRGRVAYRMLKRQFNLDDDALDDLKV